MFILFDYLRQTLNCKAHINVQRIFSQFPIFSCHFVNKNNKSNKCTNIIPENHRLTKQLFLNSCSYYEIKINF